MELLLLSMLVLMLLQLVRSYLGGLKRLVVVLEAFWTLLKASWSLRKPLENCNDTDNVDKPLVFIVFFEN